MQTSDKASWWYIAKLLNSIKDNGEALENYFLNEEHLKQIYSLNPNDITRAIHPIAILTSVKKCNHKILDEILNIWEERGVLSDVIIYIFQNGNTKSISAIINALKDTAQLKACFQNEEYFEKAMQKVVSEGQDRDISLTLNALRETPQIEACLKNEEALERAVQHIFEEGEASDIALILNALKDTPQLKVCFRNERNFERAVQHVLQEGEPHHISLTLNALRETPQIEACLKNEEALEKAVQYAFCQGDKRHISFILNALKDTPQLELCFRNERNFERAVQHVLQEGELHHISLTLNALKDTPQLEVCFKNERNFERAIREIIKNGDLQGISNTLNALKDTPQLEVCFRNERNFERAVQHVLQEGEPQHISLALNALKETPQLQVCFRNKRNFERAMQYMLEKGQTEHISRTLNALKDTPQIEIFFKNEAEFERCVQEVMKQGKAQAISLTLNALKDTPQLELCFKNGEDLESAVQHVLCKGEAKDISLTLNALKDTPQMDVCFRNERNFKKAIQYIFQKGQAKHISLILNTLKDTPQIEFCFRNEEDFERAIQEIMKNGDSQGISNTLNTLKDTPQIEFCFRNEEDFERAIQEVMKQGKSQAISLTLNALKDAPQLEICFRNEEDFERSVEEVMRNGKAQEISNTINSLKNKPQIEIFFKNEEDFERAIQEIMKNGDSQGISNTLNGLKHNFVNPNIILNLLSAFNKIFEYQIEPISYTLSSAALALHSLNMHSNQVIAAEYTKLAQYFIYNTQEISKEELMVLITLAILPLATLLQNKNFNAEQDKILLSIENIISNSLKNIGKNNYVMQVITLKYILRGLNNFDLRKVLPDQKNLIQKLIKESGEAFNKFTENFIDSQNIFLSESFQKCFAVCLSIIWEIDTTPRNPFYDTLKKSKRNLQLYSEEKFQSISLNRKDIKFNINQLLCLTILEDLNDIQNPEQIIKIETKLTEWFEKMYSNDIRDANEEEVISCIYNSYDNEISAIILEKQTYDSINRIGKKGKERILRSDPLYLFIGKEEANDIKFLNIKNGAYMARQIFSLHKIDNEYYIAGIAGGSMMKNKQTNGKVNNNGKLVAIKLKNLFSAPKTKIRQLLDKIGFREGFFYIQRALMPEALELEYLDQDNSLNLHQNSASYSKKNSAESNLDPAINSSHSKKASKVLTGKFKIHHVPEGFQINPSMPFIVYDGCGYIKKSVLSKMFSLPPNNIQPSENEIVLGGDVKIDKIDSNKRPFITYQAFQEIKKTKENSLIYDKAVEESIDKGLKRLQNTDVTVQNMANLDDYEITDDMREQNYLSCRRKYTALTTGDPEGFVKIAVPITSNNIEVLLPQNIEGEVVIGRSPYDKFNIYSPTHQQNNHIREAYGIQCSLTGSEDGKNLSFYKFVLVAIDDSKWPKSCKDSDIITGIEDRKIFSSATSKSEIKPQQNSTAIVRGVLIPVDIYRPGKFIGVVPKVQKACGGDYDGDPVICHVYSKSSYIYAIIKSNREQFFDSVNFKISKTFTLTNGFIFRLKEIMNIKNGSLLESFTYAYNVLVALNQGSLNELMQFLIYNRDEEEISKILNIMSQILEKKIEPYELLSKRQMESLLHESLSKGIKVGTDIYKTSVSKKPFFDILSYFKSSINTLHIPNPLYFKSLINKIENNLVSLEDLKHEAERQKKYYSGSYVFDVTNGIIEALGSHPNLPIVKYLSKENKNRKVKAMSENAPRTGYGVSIIVRDDENRILLGSQRKKSNVDLSHPEYLLTFPCGKVDFIRDKNGLKVQENFLIAAARELWEETGIKLDFGQFNDNIKSSKDLQDFNRNKKLLDILDEQLVFIAAINKERNRIYEVKFLSGFHAVINQNNKQSDVLVEIKFIDPCNIDNHILNAFCLNAQFFALVWNQVMMFHQNYQPLVKTSEKQTALSDPAALINIVGKNSGSLYDETDLSIYENNNSCKSLLISNNTKDTTREPSKNHSSQKSNHSTQQISGGKK